MAHAIVSRKNSLVHPQQIRKYHLFPSIPYCQLPNVLLVAGCSEVDPANHPKNLQRLRFTYKDETYHILERDGRYYVNGVWVFPPCSLTFTETLCLPSLLSGDPHPIGFDLDRNESLLYKHLQRALQSLNKDAGRHRLFGYSTPFQRTYETVHLRDCCLDQFLGVLHKTPDEKIKETVGHDIWARNRTDLPWRVSYMHGSCVPGMLQVRF